MPKHRSTEELRDVFYAKVTEMGGTVLGPEWKNASTRYRIKCSQGHLVERTAANIVHEKLKICNVCNPSNQSRSKDVIRVQFDDFIAKLGFTRIDTHWASMISRILIKCPAGHEVNANPGNCMRSRKIVCNPCKKGGVTYGLDS